MTGSAKANEQVVRDFYAAYHARDWAAFSALMAPDFAFTSPYDDAIDRQAYHARCWPPGERQTNFRIEALVGAPDGPGVFITYYMEWKPDGRGARNTEYFEVVEGRVASVHVYFGPSYRDGRVVVQTPK